jgi:hypothetical protein
MHKAEYMPLSKVEESTGKCIVNAAFKENYIMRIDFLVNLCVFAANCFWIYQFTKVELSKIFIKQNNR